VTAPAHVRGASPPPPAGGPPVILVVVAVAIAAGILGAAAAEVGKTALYGLVGIIGVGLVAYSIRDLLGPPWRDAVERAGASRFSAPHHRAPSTARSVATALIGGVAAGLAAWFLAQQGTKLMLGALALVAIAAVMWLAWPLVMLLITTPPDTPPRGRHFVDEPPVAYRGPARFIGICFTVVAAGLLAWAAAQMGIKGLIGLVGAVALVGALMIVRNRTLFFTFATVCSLTVLFHKSFGPQDLQLSGGAPAVYVTTFDTMLLLLYAIWISEGTFVADVRAAWRRRILWLPLIGALFLLPSLLVAASSWHSLAELTRMSWMYLLFFYMAVRIRTRAMVWAVLGGLTVIAAIEFVVVVLQWKTGGVLGLSFLGVPTQLTARTTDTSTIGRPFGTIIHPVFMGATVGSLSLLGLAIGLTFKRSLIKVAALAGAALCVLPLYLAHTRAALVAWAAIAGVVVLVSIARRHLAWSTVGKVVIVVLIGAAVFWPQLVNTFEENFNTGHFSEEVDSRRELNDLAGRMISDHPELGVGLNNFEVVMGPYEKYGIIFFDNPVHNLYLLYLSETGVVGFIGLLIVGIGIYNVPIRLARSRDPLFGGVGLGVAAVMGFLMVEELLGFSLRQDVPLALFWILAGLAVACSRLAGFEGSRGASSRRRWMLDGGHAGGITSATRSPRRPATSGATPRYSLQRARPAWRPIPWVLTDLLRAVPGETPLAAIKAAWPRYHVAQTQAARTEPAIRPAMAAPTPPVARRGRPRWQAGLAAGLTVVLLSFGFGGAVNPSGATVPFQRSQLKIVYVARARVGKDLLPIDKTVSPFQGIYVANGDGSGSHEILTPPHADVSYNWPQWALGGTRILFTVRDGPHDPDKKPPWENLWIMDADGQHPRPLTNYNYRAFQPKMAPDGRSVVFSALNPQFPRIATYRLDLVTGEATNLSQVTEPNGALDADPKWTPDGQHILVAASQQTTTQINQLDPDGQNRTALTADAFYNTDPEGSPTDANVVAYSSYRGAKIDITPALDDGTPNTNPDDLVLDPASWIVTVRNTVTGTETHLTQGTACVDRYPTNVNPDLQASCAPGESSGWKPVWTPDGREIGFTGVLNHDTTCICVTTADGTGAPEAIIQSSSLLLTWFDWTVPDPSKIPPTATPNTDYLSKKVESQLLISATALGPKPSLGINIEPADMMRQDTGLVGTNADGTTNGSALLIPAPLQGSYSADRKQVVFVGSARYDLNHPDPGPPPPPGQQRREHVTLADLDPVHNSRTIVTGSDALNQVFLRTADGTVRQLTDPWTEDWRDGVVTGDARSNTDPVISPDGRYVVFTSHSTLTSESFLVRLDLQTNEVLNLTNGTAGAVRVDDSSAKFSPDSQKIAFSWTQGSATDIFVMRAADGLAITHVTDDNATNITPAWSPDGRFVVYSHHEGQIDLSPIQLPTLSGLPLDHWTLVKIEVATGRETVLSNAADGPAFKPVWAPEGDRIYFIGVGPRTFDVFSADPNGAGVKPVLITPAINETSIDWR